MKKPPRTPEEDEALRVKIAALLDEKALSIPYGVLARMGHLDHETRDELLAIARLKLVQCAKLYDPTRLPEGHNSFHAYAFHICRLEVRGVIHAKAQFLNGDLEKARSLRGKTALVPNLFTQPDHWDCPEPEREPPDYLAREAAARYLAALDDNRRTACTMYYLEGASVKAITKRLRVSKQGVHYLVSDGVRRMREMAGTEECS